MFSVYAVIFDAVFICLPGFVESEFAPSGCPVEPKPSKPGINDLQNIKNIVKINQSKYCLNIAFTNLVMASAALLGLVKGIAECGKALGLIGTTSICSVQDASSAGLSNLSTSTFKVLQKYLNINKNMVS